LDDKRLVRLHADGREGGVVIIGQAGSVGGRQTVAKTKTTYRRTQENESGGKRRKVKRPLPIRPQKGILKSLKALSLT